MHLHEIVQTIILFIIVLGFMVLIHELGHFLVAKFFGVRVERFSIGMPPRLFGFKYGDTDYCISALPIGGYVKMAGEYGAETTAAAPDDLNSKPRWQRILIALAGPCANFLLSFLLLFAVAHWHHEVDQYLNGPAVVDYVPKNTAAANDGMVAGDTIVQFAGVPNPTWQQILEESNFNLNHAIPLTYLHNGQQTTRTLTLTSADGEFTPENLAQLGLMPSEQSGPITVQVVSGNTPAERAGLKAGDQILSIDGVPIHSLLPLHSYLNDRAGAPSVLSILRDGKPMLLAVVPERVDSDPKAPQYQIGFQKTPAPVDVERMPWKAAVHQSLKDNRKGAGLILRVLQGLFTRHVSVKQMSGPVGIAQDIGLAWSMGTWPLLQLVSLISLNLGIFNLLPIPILDGGMILFLLVESLIRRDVNFEVKERVYQVAFVCIILFACFVLFNDITKLHVGGH
jgi:regulator of sigma E protease